MNSRRVRDCKGFGVRLAFVHLRFISVGFREKGTGTIIRVTGYRLQVTSCRLWKIGIVKKWKGNPLMGCGS